MLKQAPTRREPVSSSLNSEGEALKTGAIGTRIIVVGSSNAGKSTVAARLCTALSIPWTDLDALHWEPGWTEADPDVFRHRVRAATSSDSWILAGNYIPKQQDISWPCADTIVWLDIPMRTALRRCARRSRRRWRDQEALYGGDNREVFWEHLTLWDTDKSLFAHIIKTHRQRRRDFAAMMTESQWTHLTFVHLRSVEEIERWLHHVASGEYSLSS